MLITKYNLIEPWLLRYKSNFNHMITALYHLHGKHLLHRLHRMRQHFIFFSFIDDFEHAGGVVRAVEPKLNIVLSCLKHY